jgi:hypothetical protein
MISPRNGKGWQRRAPWPRDAESFGELVHDPPRSVYLWKAAEIRIRAERRAGQLLREMKENGQRQKPGDNAGAHRGRKRSSNGTSTLSDLGITYDQSTRWQRDPNVEEHDNWVAETINAEERDIDC